jgi:hypothetical protein
MKNFLIGALGGYTKKEIVVAMDMTVKTVNELLEGKDINFEIKTKDIHFEGKAIAGEIGIFEVERVSLGSLIREAKAKLEEIMKSEPATEDKKPVAKKRVAKKTSTKRKAIMKSNITKTN